MIEIEVCASAVQPIKEIQDWLNSLPFNDWEWNDIGNKVIFYKSEDALEFRLRFGL
jgi:hypothetical protein